MQQCASFQHSQLLAGPLSLIRRFQIQSHLLSMEQLLFSRVHSLGGTHASKGRKYGFTKVQSASDLITVKYQIYCWSLYLNGLLSCSSGARWHAYLRRCLSERMTMRKRFYASMRLPTFTKVLPNAIFNLQLYIEKILNEFLESSETSRKCCFGQ